MHHCHRPHGPHVPSTCWPDDHLDGFREFNPPGAVLQAYWNAEILDLTGIPSNRIIPVAADFAVRFRLELAGPAWRCMTGDWVFDLRFDEQGGPEDFRLSSRLPVGALTRKGWRGCEDGANCVEQYYVVPAGTIAEAVYEITATMRLHCCDKPGPVVGFDPLEEYQWFA